MGNLVGPVLSAAGGRVGLVVSAIRDDNTGTPLQVLDCGSHVYVLAPHHLLATATSLRWHLGPAFGLGALESIVLDSVGRMHRTADTVTWRPGDHGVRSGPTTSAWPRSASV